MSRCNAIFVKFHYYLTFKKKNVLFKSIKKLEALQKKIKQSRMHKTFYSSLNVPILKLHSL